METAPTPENRITVPKILSDTQVAFFVDNGYLVLESLVTPEEVERLRQDTVHLARGGYPCENLAPLPATLTDDEALRRILCIHQPHYLSPVMLKVALIRKRQWFSL